jgi:hypothetical protein
MLATIEKEVRSQNEGYRTMDGGRARQWRVTSRRKLENKNLAQFPITIFQFPNSRASYLLEMKVHPIMSFGIKE